MSNTDNTDSAKNTENNSDEQEDDVSSLSSNFEKKYQQVLRRLNDLYHSRLLDEDAFPVAAFCLIAQNALFTDLKSYDVKSRAFKSDIKFAEADAYKKLKSAKTAEKKPTETELAQLVAIDPAVKEAIQKQIDAETEYKHLINLQNLLKEAHLTFRSIKKGANSGV
jgi:hypothetical protein